MWKGFGRLNWMTASLYGRQALRLAVVSTLGRWLDVVSVLEYPKCGASWVRRMVQTYFGNADESGKGRLLARNAVFQSHSLYRRMFRNPIIVVRDPRDVFVSFYYFETHYEGRTKSDAIERYFTHDPERPLRDDFAAYLDAKLQHVTSPPFSYGQFLDSWLNRPDACLVKYEDCLEDPKEQLVRIISFLKQDVDPERVRYAVEENRFEKRTLAKYGVSREAGQADPTKFVRKGIAGDWRNHFNEDSCRLLERLEGGSLRRLGYECDEGWIEEFLKSS